MNDDYNIFSISTEENHRGESLVSILIILVSVSLVVGLFYSFMGSNKSADAIYYPDNSTNAKYREIFDDGMIRFDIPSDFSLIEKDILSNKILSDAMLSNHVYQIPDTQSNIIVVKSKFTDDVSLLDIFSSGQSLSSFYSSPMILSFTQNNFSDVEYEVIYSSENAKVHSREKMIKIRKNSDYFVYLIAFHTDNNSWNDYDDVCNELFSSIKLSNQ